MRSSCHYPLKQQRLCTKLRVLEYGEQRKGAKNIKHRLLKFWQRFFTMSDSHIRQHSEQRSPLNCTGSHSQPPSSYWGKLSKIWLTKRALKELNRRNIKSNEYSPPYRPFRRSLTRSLLAEWAKGQQSASDILDSYSEKDLEGLKQFSRVGGPDTSDLRGVFITRCSYPTRILIRASIQNLLILSIIPPCHRQTTHLLRRKKMLLIR